MSEMIERVAEAIGCIDADRCTRQRTAPSKRTKWQMKPCDLCMDAARNAIEAMREPTEAMLDAAWRLPDDGPAIIYKSAIEEKWREMIEAALKDD
jgi:hypothetical protein